MSNTRNAFFNPATFTVVLFILLINTSGRAQAHVSIWQGLSDMNISSATIEKTKAGTVGPQILDDGVPYVVPFMGNKVDLVMPKHITHKYLAVTLRAGDGGIRSNHKLAKTLIVKGGGAATITAIFETGSENDQIGENDRLRMLIGRQGASVESVETNGGDGGAGTGLFLKKSGTQVWTTLAVAGGGGGAYSDCCSVTAEGHSASSIPDGKDGGGVGGKGGSNGNDGNVTGTAHAGGGVNAAFTDGKPVGSTDFDADPGEDGLFGCGHGGDGSGSGGGGGGYSGGGAGGTSAAGGGGGTYYNPQMRYKWLKIKVSDHTSTPQDGYILFEFIDELPLLPSDPAIKLAAAPQKCIDVESQMLHDGNNVQLWDCNPYVPTQSWAVDGLKIKLIKDDNKCLNVDGGSTNNATNIRIRNCNNTNAQNWIYDGLTQQVRSALDVEKCMNDAYGGRTDNGTNIILWDCNDGDKSDQWTISGSTVVSDPDEVKYIVPIKATGLALQSASGAQWGSNVQLWTRDPDNIAERWMFDGVQIKYGPSKDLCMTLKDANTANGTNIELRGCSDTDAKKWVYDGMTMQIRSAVNPNKCMEVQTSGVYEKGQNIHIMDCNQHSRQQFKLKS